MKMRQGHAVWVLFALFTASFFAGFHSYRTTENGVRKDMMQALAQTMAEQQSDVINQDTIRVFNSHLQWKELQGRATLAVDTRQKTFSCYAKCSAATIFSLSDQRPAMVLWTLTMLWVMFCMYQRRRGWSQPASRFMEGHSEYGGLIYCDTDGKFLNTTGETIRLTPMQQQLMEMFFQAPSHQLSKTEICDALWPKKPDATDTLYTLIRRLRPVIEQHSNLQIESDRGKSYRLISKDL